MIIDVRLSGQTLSLPQSPIVLAEGAVNAVRFQLIPDDEWADMSITATFRSVGELGDEIARDVLVHNKSVSFPIPPEVLRSGYLYIGCTGTAEAGELVLTTKVLDRPLTVWTAERLAEEWAKAVTPDVAAQILAILGDMSKLDTASKNNLVAAINECYGKNPTKIIPVSAHSGNGFSYIASGEQLPTVVPGSAGAHVGKGAQIVFIPDMTNTEPECTLQINGGSAVPIRRRAKTGTQSANGIDATLPMKAGVLIRGVPYTLTFCGLYWLLDSYVPLDGGGGGIDPLELAQAVEDALTDAVENGEVAPAAHEHSYSELKDKPPIPQIPDSLPANGGNADTVGGKTAEQIQHAAEATIPTAVNTALQAAKESGEFNGKSPVIEMSGTAEGTIMRVVNADGGEEEVLIRDGRNGEPGLNGLSAYQVAEQQGFEGTISEWIDSLHGVGITKAEINASGQLILTLSNGQTANVGKVVGANGISPIISVSAITGGSRITITDANGTKTVDMKDGKTPEKGVDYFTEADKVEMVERVRTSMDDVPNYWQAALDEGAEAINTALCNAGRNKSAFLFYSDTHWNYGSGMAPALLKHLYQHTGMNKTFFGGDIVNDEATDYDTMEYLWDWRRQLKGLPNHHSVPGNHDDGNSTNNLFSEEYVYGYLLASEETHDMVCGDKGLYYYVDNPAEKTRYLCLDTGFKDASALSDDQREFIKASLKSVPAGWHIVVVAHIWYGLDYDQYDKRPVPVAGLSATASSVLAILDNYNSRNGEFSECGGWVEFCIGGHIHYDYDAVSATGIPIILVETDSHHTRGRYTATVGTATESAVSGIVADYSAHKIHVIRIGRGASREVEVTNYVVSYTNVLPRALAADGVSVYNADDTPGYKANIRWSSSSNAEGSSTGTYITGWIPAKAGDVIRLKNITMPYVNGNTCMIHNFNNSFTTAYENLGVNSGFTVENYAIVKDENNNVVQFTIRANALSTHIRIQCGGIDDTSIITINEPIE